MLRAWIAEHGVRILNNIAGNRASQAPGIETLVTADLQRHSATLVISDGHEAGIGWLVCVMRSGYSSWHARACA